MYIAHGPISYLANEVIQNKKIKQLKRSEQILVALCSLFFGILPDFDILILFMLGAPRFIHHDIITHTPVFYIGIWVVLKISIHFLSQIFNKKTKKVLDKRVLNILADTFLIATLFHLLADFLVNSIPLLYPFSNFRFYVLKFIFEPNVFAGLTFSPFFAIELFFITIFLYVVYKKFFTENKVVKVFLQLLIGITVIYLPFSMYISSNTYNSTFMYGPDGEINYDIDYDGISDSMDMDVGNTGESNIQKANRIEILDSTIDIVNSNKWTHNHENDLIAKIKYMYGGFDSFRIVAQAYYDNNLPITPVLNDFHIKQYGFKSYFYDDYDYPNLLLNYLGVNDQFLELNLDVNPELEPGKIFFVMESAEEKTETAQGGSEEMNLEILNLAITLEGNYLAIVLDIDENLTIHSYTSLREYYGEDIEKIYIQK
jgi:hypothetical protein